MERGDTVFFQKSHDWEFTDPLVVPGTHRVVQYRSPVPRALSNYELHLQNGEEDTLQTFRNFLAREALYTWRFYRKWIRGRALDYFFLPYEELTSDPFKAMSALFRHIGVAVTSDDVEQGVAAAMPLRSRENIAFAPTDVYAHRYAKYPVLANFEDLVIRNCPGYRPMTYFRSKESEKSLVGFTFEALKAIDVEDGDAAMAAVEAAQKHDPDNPLLLGLRARARALRETDRDLPSGSFDRKRIGQILSPQPRPKASQSAEGVRWFHSFYLDAGEVIDGIKPLMRLRAEADVIFSEPVVGKTVLDIGAWDGYFSFEAERRGAADVLATDHFCWSGPGWGTKAGFDYVHARLGSQVRAIDVDVFSLDPAVLGPFDVCLFLGVFYHLKNPLGGLEQVFRMTREFAVIETEVTAFESPYPVLRFYEGKSLNNDRTNFFVPNHPCLEAMLREVGFTRFKFTPATHSADRERGRTIVHAWK